MATTNKSENTRGWIETGAKIVGGALLINYLLQRNDGGGYGTAHDAKHCKNAFKKKNLSFNETLYQVKADQIYAAVWDADSFGLTENDQTVADVFKTLLNDNDVQALICAYGVRGEGFLVNDYYSLIGTTTKFLDCSEVEEVNADWLSKGITYTLVCG